MGIARQVLLWCSEQRWLGEQAQRRRFTRKAVLRFMPGEEVEAAVQAAEELSEQRITTMLHELGENVTDTREAQDATSHYCTALDRVAEAGLDAHISIKLTHIGLDLDLELTCRNLASLLEHAGKQDNFVWIDMEGSAYTDRTLELFRRAKKEFPNVGVCLQTYLYRTAKDLEALLPLGPTVRLVKGAYSETEEIAYKRRRDVDENFFTLAAGLLGEDARRAGARLAAATHDLKLIHRIRDLAKTTGVSKDGLEIQMLYGIQPAAQLELVDAGHQVRVLISYGTDWFPWYVRRLAERPANVWFLLRNLF